MGLLITRVEDITVKEIPGTIKTCLGAPTRVPKVWVFNTSGARFTVFLIIVDIKDLAEYQGIRCDTDILSLGILKTMPDSTQFCSTTYWPEPQDHDVTAIYEQYHDSSGPDGVDLLVLNQNILATIMEAGTELVDGCFRSQGNWGEPVVPWPEQVSYPQGFLEIMAL